MKIAFDVGFICKAKKIEEVGIYLHIFDGIKALREKEHIKFIMMAIHGEKLVKTFPLTAMLQSHDTYIIYNDKGLGLNVRLFDTLRHCTVCFNSVPSCLYCSGEVLEMT